MRLLLDTHILLWLMAGDRRLGKDAWKVLEDAEERYVSSASIWELSIKWRQGRLEENPELLAAYFDPAGLMELPVSNRHALATTRLPFHHKDPFDRLLVAQAITEGMRLVTADPALLPYSNLVTLV